MYSTIYLLRMTQKYCQADCQMLSKLAKPSSSPSEIVCTASAEQDRLPRFPLRPLTRSFWLVKLDIASLTILLATPAHPPAPRLAYCARSDEFDSIGRWTQQRSTDGGTGSGKACTAGEE